MKINWEIKKIKKASMYETKDNIDLLVDLAPGLI